MAAAFVPVVPGGSRLVKWGINLAYNSYYGLMERPAESATDSGLLAPFGNGVWILTLVSLIGMGPAIYLMMRLRKRIRPDHSTTAFPLRSCMWFVYGAVMKQGSSLNPVADSVRLLFASWWIFIMVLTAFYTANLTAFLTLTRFTLPFQSAEDIERQHRKWFALEGGAVEYAIMDNEDGELEVLKSMVHKDIGKFLKREESKGIIVKRLLSEGYLYIEEDIYLRNYLQNDYVEKAKLYSDDRNRCTYVLTPHPILVRNLAFAYPLGSNLPSLFNPVLQSFVDSGMIKHTIESELPDKNMCPLNIDSKFLVLPAGVTCDWDFLSNTEHGDRRLYAPSEAVPTARESLRRSPIRGKTTPDVALASERQLRNSDLLTTYYLVATGFATAVTVFVLEILVRKCSHPMKIRSWPVDVTSRDKPRARFGEGRSEEHTKVNINGREYYIVISKEGEKRYIPIRTPSALLFQYAPK